MNAFDEYTKKEGGIYIPEEGDDLDTIIITMNQEIKKLHSFNSKQPEIMVYYIDNEKMNARAFIIDNKYYIGIYKGTVQILKEIFDDVSLKMGFNKKKSRKLLLYSMKYLVYHECIHIVCGHVDFKNFHKNNNNELLVEYFNSYKDIVLFNQTCEMNADNGATSYIVDILEIVYLGNIEKFIDELCLFVLSSYILFKCIDNNEHVNYETYDLNNLYDKSHTRAGIRMHFMLSVINTILHYDFDDIDSDIAEYISQKFVSYIVKYESALGNMIKTNEDLRNIELGISYTEKGCNHIMNIHNYWRKVKDLLEPFSYEDLPDFVEYTALNEEFID